MPCKECDRVAYRREIVELAIQADANVAEIARRFGVSRKVIYRWMDRWQAEGPAGLQDRSRRPRSSPSRTEPAVEDAVVTIRRDHPAWGGRKISRILRNRGFKKPPAPSTVTSILRRHDLIDPSEPAGSQPWQRFERPDPNDLMQMDFKGHFDLEDGSRCHPLTMIDDHSRYCLALRALDNERGSSVTDELVSVFEKYGLPRQILADNGGPWGGKGESYYTKLSVWLIDHGVEVIHGRPRHPQTQGKDERFHRTLKAEAIRGRSYRNLAESQQEFDRWRVVYNHERPHDSLDLDVPASRYRVSRREFRATLKPWEYAPGVAVRKVAVDGRFSFKGVSWKIGRAFKRLTVGVQPTTEDGIYDVLYRHVWVANLDFNKD